MKILPDFSVMGLLDYGFLAAGMIVGFALLQRPMNELEDAIRRN